MCSLFKAPRVEGGSSISMNMDQIESRAPSQHPMIVSATKAPATSVRKVNRTRVFMGVGAAALLAAAGWLGYDYLTAGRFMVTTDDAYVRAYNTTLGAKVAGYVS